MGYEIKLIIGKASETGSPEYEEDKNKPFDDGSGFEWKKDEHGKPIPTGRTSFYFRVMAELDLCKIGHGSDPLVDLIDKTQKEAMADKYRVFEFYGTGEGDKAVQEDKYGVKFLPVSVRDLLTALQSRKGEDYRRFDWAIALLESMKDDIEGIQVIFYGH